MPAIIEAKVLLMAAISELHGRTIGEKSSTPGLSSRSAAQAQHVSGNSVYHCGLALPTLISHKPCLFKERFPFTCAPPFVQAPAFQMQTDSSSRQNSFRFLRGDGTGSLPLAPAVADGTRTR